MQPSPFDDIASISCLTIMRDGTEPLEVPLEPVDGSPYEDLRLFEGGMVWEDEPARFSFSLVSTAVIRRATLTVNDHNDLWLKHTYEELPYLGGKRAFRYTYEPSPNQTARDYRYPFNLSCGFARVSINLHFADGREATYESHDVVCLDETRRGNVGAAQERLEEGNVRDMYGTLTLASGDQAAEWMFSKEAGAPGGGSLSSDSFTDWAHESLARLLTTASEALDLVYDGLEDTQDEFPNTCAGADGPSFDTPENRAVRALLVALAARTNDAWQTMAGSVDELVHLTEWLKELVAKEGAVRKACETLPAIKLFDTQCDNEAAWLVEARDLAERAAFALEEFDGFVGGAGAVAAVPFEVPPREGLYRESAIYAELRDAMVAWEGVHDLHVERRDVALHVIKPDRLFEYYALQRMLSWLFDQGFRENEALPRPIERFAYNLADTYDKYDNEGRCANTYHLRRTEDGCEVDLYYQAVLYGDSREENGISIHRCVPTDDGQAGFWTPDYLLRVRDGKDERTYAIDAKYCDPKLLKGSGGKLADCVEKYLVGTRTGMAGEPGHAVDGVWILSGRLNTGPLCKFGIVKDELVEEGKLPKGVRATCGIAPVNRNSGKRKMKALFSQLGIPPLG